MSNYADHAWVLLSGQMSRIRGTSLSRDEGSVMRPKLGKMRAALSD
jgi:hypothetical protein